MELKKLNLGCQVHYFDGWINQDVVGDDPNVKTDLVCDAAKLPLEDNSIDFIYAGHLIEHFYPNTVGSAVLEWYRVLKPGGQLVVVTPDSGQCFKRYAVGELKIADVFQQVYGRIYDYDRPEERHHIVFDRDYLLYVLSQQGKAPWREFHDMDFNNPPSELKPFMDKDISRGFRHMQLGIVLTK